MLNLSAQASLQTPQGDFSLESFVGPDLESQKTPILVLAMGLDEISETGEIPLIRIHSECITGDVFSSRRCDCGEQLTMSMELISERGCGAVIYLRQEGRGIGIENKLKAYALQEQGFDTLDANLELGLPADSRDYHDAIKILEQHGVTRCDLLTNNPEKTKAIEQSKIALNSVLPIHIKPDHPSCVQYLTTKQQRMGHLSNLD
jgi:GTP cyclohydrolase II